MCIYSELAANAAAGWLSQEIISFVVSDGCSSGVVVENKSVWLYQYESDSFT